MLVDDRLVVSDSTAILRHLEERQPEPRLYPHDPARRAEAEVFVDWFNRVWKVAPNALESGGPTRSCRTSYAARGTSSRRSSTGATTSSATT